MIDLPAQNISFYWATIFFRKLVKNGIRHVIISPGSRSTPLTMAAAAHPHLQKQVILDERTAAFTALGIGKATGKPAVLICTSGTAAANYFPAVIEARQSGVPMILTTADRPPHLRSTGANQAIDQLKLFGNYPVFFHEAGEPRLGDEDLNRLAMLARQAVGMAQQRRGPVHLNFPFRKPLEPEPAFVKKIKDENNGSEAGLMDHEKFQYDGSFHLPAEIQQALLSAQRPLIIVGPTAPADNIQSVAQLAEKLNGPILSESAMPGQHAVSGFAAFLRNNHIRKQLKPDLILRFGFQPTVKSLEEVLRDWNGGHHFHFASTHDWQDATFSESTHLPWLGRPLSFDGLPDVGGKIWLRKWKKYEQLANEHLQKSIHQSEALTDGHIYHHLLPQCTDEPFIAVSNSFPARDIQLFGGQATTCHSLFLNRGASGIDGVTSTAMGISLGLEQPGVLFTGDLAFLHDTNALLNSGMISQNLTVIVVNNSGGSIFRMLPIEQHDLYFKDYFETPQSADIRQLVESFDIPCHRIETLEEIRQFDLRQWQKQHNGLSVIECRTDADASMELRKTLGLFAMTFSEINGHMYAYQVHQQRVDLPSLLMLHGFMGDQRAFDHLIEELCYFCNPVTVDLLGHGQSSRPTHDRHYREEQQIADLRTFIDQLDVKNELFLHGYSMGGRLALKTTLAAPELVGGLILESTNCGIRDERQRSRRRKTDEQRAREMTTGFDRFLEDWQRLPLFKSPVSGNEQLQKKYMNIQREQSPEAVAASLRGFGAGSMRPCWDELPSLTLPVLLMAGTHDEKYQHINQRLVQQLPNAHFSSLTAGHRVHLDNPSAFINEIKSFIP